MGTRGKTHTDLDAEDLWSIWWRGAAGSVTTLSWFLCALCAFVVNQYPTIPSLAAQVFQKFGSSNTSFAIVRITVKTSRRCDEINTESFLENRPVASRVVWVDRGLRGGRRLGR